VLHILFRERRTEGESRRRGEEGKKQEEGEGEEGYQFYNRLENRRCERQIRQLALRLPQTFAKTPLISFVVKFIHLFIFYFNFIILGLFF
jgi:hypothetical protein